MGRRETGLFGRIFNALTGTGTTVTRTTDFWGNKKTIVHNYDTGTTKEYTHNQGFWGNRTDVKVKRNGKEIRSGHIKKNFWGNDIETMNYHSGKIRKSVKKMNTGFFGNHDNTDYYDASGNQVANRHGRRGLIFNSYEQHYSGECFRCNGTGIFEPTGKTCRRCGGTGIYKK